MKKIRPAKRGGKSLEVAAMGRPVTAGILARECGFQALWLPEGEVAEVRSVYCGDLPGLALSRLGEGAAWVTALGHEIAVAVAFERRCACLLLCEGAQCPAFALEQAKAHRVPVLRSRQPAFETALAAYGVLEGLEGRKDD